MDSSLNLYIGDWSNHVVRKMTSSAIVTTYSGSTTGGTSDGTLTSATFGVVGGLDIASDGTVYVVDVTTNRIRKISSSGEVTTLAGSTQGYLDGIGTNALFKTPSILRVDIGGDLFVTDGNNVIRRITGSGL